MLIVGVRNICEKVKHNASLVITLQIYISDLSHTAQLAILKQKRPRDP